jgi:predicted transposase YdaD
MKTFIDEYIEQGRKKGKQEGRQEGMQQAGYKILSTQLTHRFGDLPLSP